MALRRTNTTTRKRKTHRSASAAEANVTSATSTRWITAGVLALYVFGAIVSFFGLYGVAPWLKIPEPFWWAVPAMVDLGIVLYKFAEIKLRLDPRKAHLARRAKAGVLISTIVSSGANGFHVWQARDPDPVALYVGLTLAALAPWFVYLAGSVLTDIIVKPKPLKKPNVSRETSSPSTEVVRLPAPRRKPAPRTKVAMGEEGKLVPADETHPEIGEVLPDDPQSFELRREVDTKVPKGW